jgi:hypothetical protein
LSGKSCLHPRPESAQTAGDDDAELCKPPDRDHVRPPQGLAADRHPLDRSADLFLSVCRPGAVVLSGVRPEPARPARLAR